MENTELGASTKTGHDETDEKISLSGVSTPNDELTDPEVFEDAALEENDDRNSYMSAAEYVAMLEDDDVYDDDEGEDKEAPQVPAPSMTDVGAKEAQGKTTAAAANEIQSLIVDKLLSHIPVRVKSKPEINATQNPSCPLKKSSNVESVEESNVPIRVKECALEPEKLAVGGVPKNLSKESSVMSILKTRNNLTNNAEIIMEAETEGEKQSKVEEKNVGKAEANTLEIKDEVCNSELKGSARDLLAPADGLREFSATSSTCPSEASKKSKVSLASKIRSKFGRNRMVTAKKPKKKPAMAKIKPTKDGNSEMIDSKGENSNQMVRPLPKPSRRAASSDVKFSIRHNLAKKPVLYASPSAASPDNNNNNNVLLNEATRVDSSAPIRESRTSFKRSGSPYRISELFPEIDANKSRQSIQLKKSVSPERSRHVSPKSVVATDEKSPPANQNPDEGQVPDENDELEKLKKYYDAQLGEIKALNREINSLKQKQKESEQVIENSKISINKLNSQITRKATDLDDAKSAFEKISKRNEELRNELNAERKKLCELNDKYNKLFLDIASLKEDKFKYEKTCSEREAEIKKLEALLYTECEKSHENLEERDKMIEDLKSVLTEVQNRCGLLEDKNVALHERIVRTDQFIKELEADMEETRRQSMAEQARIKYLYKIISSLGAKIGKDISPSNLESIALDTSSEENYLTSNILRDFENFVHSKDEEISKCKATIEEISRSNDEKQKLLDEFYEYANKTHNVDHVNPTVVSRCNDSARDNSVLTRRSNDLIAALEAQRQGMMMLEKRLREIEYDRSKSQSHNEYLIAQYESMLLLPSHWIRKEN